MDQLAVWRPATTERPVQLNERSQFLLSQPHEIELALKQISLRVQDGQVAVQTTLVSLGRQLRRGGERFDEMFLLEALFVGLRISRESIRDVAERAVDHALIVHQRFTVDR